MKTASTVSRKPDGLRRTARPITMGDMGRPQKKPDLSSYSKRVGHRVRVLRMEHEWTVEELWLKLRDTDAKVSAGTIRSWEVGRRLVHPDMYPTLAKVFGLSVREFLPAK